MPKKLNKVQRKAVALARKLFGENDARISQLEKIFDERTDDLINDLNRFIANDVTWRGPADKKLAVQLERQMAQVIAQALTDGMKFFVNQVFDRVPNHLKTNADVMTAKTYITVVQLAFNEKRSLEESKRQMAETVFDKYPMIFPGHADSRPTYANKDKVKPFSRAETEQAIEDVIKNNWAGLTDEAAIYKEKLQAVRKLDKTLNDIYNNKQAPRDFEKEFAKTFNSSRKRASGILRTEATAMFANSAIECLKLRGIDRYRIIIADRDTCVECRAMDDQIFNVRQAIIGLNLPPFHTHCQCKVIPAPLDYA